MMNSYVALDLETTGLRPAGDRILEIGAVRIDGGEVTGYYETFIDCEAGIPAQITQLTGITEEMVKGSPDRDAAVGGFLEFSGDAVLLGHNLSFDYGFMKQNVTEMGLSYERRGIDTLRIARACLPELPKRSLDALSKYFGIPQERHHRALDDALTAARLYERLKEEFGEEHGCLFEPSALTFRAVKKTPATNSQKRYLRDLLKYHRIESDVKIEALTRADASRMIDGIILQYGRIIR